MTGALYFDSVKGAMMVYNGMDWQLWNDTGANNPAVGQLRSSYEETLTMQKGTFPFEYTVGSEVVVLNGIVLATDDYTADDGHNIILKTPAEIDDVIFITAYGHASTKGVYTKQEVDYLLSKVIGTHMGVADLNMDDNRIVNVEAPRPGVSGVHDAVNREYVDNLGNQLYTTTTDAVEAQITVGGAMDKYEAVKMLGAQFRGAELIDGDTIVVEKTTTAANDKHEGIYFYDKDTDKWYFAGTGTGSAAMLKPTINLREDHTDAVPQGDLMADLDVVAEDGFNAINVYNGGIWREVLSEQSIQSWIAAGSLFQGTIQSMAELGNLPVPDISNKGFYWTWTGPANTDVTVADFTNGGGFDDTLQVGDWLQSDGIMYKHVPSDLMSKQRWESVGSFRPWVGSHHMR